jgi:hypothetical protein
MNPINDLNKKQIQLIGKASYGANPTLLNRQYDIDGFIKFGPEEITKTREAIMRMVYFQIENGCCLTSMALAFQAIQYGGELSRLDAASYANLASNQAERSRYNINLIRKIID